jgi:hypothetical protein
VAELSGAWQCLGVFGYDTGETQAQSAGLLPLVVFDGSRGQ